MASDPILWDQIQTMNKNYPILAAIILFFSTIDPVIAQFPVLGNTGTTTVQSPKGNVKISGTLIDSSSLKGVEYASIALYKLPGDKAVDGTVSDEKGKFNFNKIEAGEYKVLISFIGYQTKTIEKLNFSKGQEFDLSLIHI